jgi:hypothetical protein
MQNPWQLATTLVKWLLLLCVMITSSKLYAAETLTIVKYVKRNAPYDLRDYKNEVVALLLEATKPEFGDYRIQPFIGEPSLKRRALLISEGEQINLTWASPGTNTAKAEVITIPVDIMRGLQGYRICMINSENTTEFNTVTDIPSLAKIRIGQSTNWAEKSIYDDNKIPVVIAPNFESLFTMVLSNRFDCVALGAHEIINIYREKLLVTPKLAIEKSLVIYYEYPIYFYVSAKHPTLAERLKRGLQLTEENGEFDRLFERHFRNSLVELNLPVRHLVCLRSPYLPLVNQCKKNAAEVANRYLK